MDMSSLPEHMWNGVRGYYEHGWQPGSFLYAVLTNNLTESAAQADEINKKYLFEWASFMYNEMPLICRGSEENVQEWIRKGGKQGA